MSLALARLTALSTQTLSLLLERQRLQNLSSNSTGLASPAAPNPLHLPQITRNLGQLRVGILGLEEKDGKSEAVELLRNQYERMRGMLGMDGRGVERWALPTAAGGDHSW
jgi:syntaxin 8